MKSNPNLHPVGLSRQQAPIAVTDLITSGEFTPKTVVKSGLRPKKKPKLTSDSISSQQSVKRAIKSNVFDAYCDHILPWKLEITPKNAFENHELLPSTYESASKYVEHWEPLLIEETKCAILNTFNSLRVNQSHCKIMKMSRISESSSSSASGEDSTTMTPPPSTTNLVKVDCTNLYQVSPSQSKIRQDMPSPFDLLLISWDPFSFPITYKCLKGKQWMLGMVMSHRERDVSSSNVPSVGLATSNALIERSSARIGTTYSSSGRNNQSSTAAIVSTQAKDSFQIKIFHEFYSQLELIAFEQSLSSATSSASSLSSSVAPVTATPLPTFIAVMPSTSAPPRTIVKPTVATSKRPHSSVSNNSTINLSINSNNNSNSRNCSSTNLSNLNNINSNSSSSSSSTTPQSSSASQLQAHYIILDSLSSPWREFLALHELHSGSGVVCLRDEFLANQLRPLHLPSTPPTVTATVDHSPNNNVTTIDTSDKNLNNNNQAQSSSSSAVASSYSLQHPPAITTANGDNSNMSITTEAEFSPPVYSPVATTASTATATTGTAAAINNMKSTAINTADTSSSSAMTASSSLLVPSSTSFASLPWISDSFLTRLVAKNCNQSQFHAVYSALKNDKGFTLIQGPPGTGKTNTIITILNSIHVREYNRYYASMIAAVLGNKGITCRIKGTADSAPWIQLVSDLALTKPHILVAAPSNVAVDNIVERILLNGFQDSGGKIYKPNMLRFGGGKSQSVAAVSLEEIVEQEQQISGVSGSTGGASDRDRRLAIDQVNQQINTLVQEIFALQTFLINLRTAFTNYQPLPKGFELRVSVETGLPYWVDHFTRTVSYTPPVPINATAAVNNSASAFLASTAAMSNNSATTNDTASSAVNQQQQKGADLLLQKRGISDATFETLPEYRKYSQNITRALNQLHRCSLKKSRCQVRLRPNEYGGYAAARQLCEASVVDSSEIFFTTLNSAGHACLESTRFVVTVIDEAAQCSEPSILIPLRKGVQQCILVGDPYQLPATLFSDHTRRLGYDRSLFERLMDTGHPKVLLNTQYRMHPSISAFPSQTFYASALLDGENVKRMDYEPDFLRPNNKNNNAFKNKLPLSSVIATTTNTENRTLSSTSSSSTSTTAAMINPFSSHVDNKANNGGDNNSNGHKTNNDTNNVNINVLQPFLFFDLASSRDQQAVDSLSKININEAKFVVALLQLLVSETQRTEKRVPESRNSGGVNKIDKSASNDDISESAIVKQEVMSSSSSSSAAADTASLSSKLMSIAVHTGSIGIITPYSEQVNEITRHVTAAGFALESSVSSTTQQQQQSSTTSVASVASNKNGGTAMTGTTNITSSIGGSSSNSNNKRECSSSTASTSSDIPRSSNATSSSSSTAPKKKLMIDVEINTVDGFQGKEKDFIIISCVRANDTHSVGFLSDFRRLNVALTRAQYGLFIIGFAPTLQRNELWGDLIRHTFRTNSYVHIDIDMCLSPFSASPSANTTTSSITNSDSNSARHASSSVSLSKAIAVSVPTPTSITKSEVVEKVDDEAIVVVNKEEEKEEEEGECNEEEEEVKHIDGVHGNTATENSSLSTAFIATITDNHMINAENVATSSSATIENTTIENTSDSFTKPLSSTTILNVNVTTNGNAISVEAASTVGERLRELLLQWRLCKNTSSASASSSSSSSDNNQVNKSSNKMIVVKPKGAD